MSFLLDHRLELTHEKLVFKYSNHIICVRLNITGINKEGMVDLVLEEELEEQAISWTIKNVTVKIWPITLEKKSKRFRPMERNDRRQGQHAY